MYTFKHVYTLFRKCLNIYKIATEICISFKLLCIPIFSFYHFNLSENDRNPGE